MLSKKEQNGYPDQFQLSDESITSDMNLINNEFNYFFINMGRSLSRKIPNQTSTFDSFVIPTAFCSWYQEPVTACEISKLVTLLKTASPGYDNISIVCH